MNIQRVRNLTTGILHTQVSDIYEDIEAITGEEGIMMHQLGNANTALEPYLREILPDERYWNGQWDTEHTGEVDVPAMNDEQRSLFFERFGALPSPLANLGKDAVVLAVMTE
jgi:hypothetical protein